MGEVAEMMLDGTLCEGCGEYIGDPVGFPQYCSDECAGYPIDRISNKDKKSRNKDWSTQHLIDKGIRFESKNNGVHLIVYGDKGIVDFWPSTGKWISRYEEKTSRGIRELVKYISEEPQ